MPGSQWSFRSRAWSCAASDGVAPNFADICVLAVIGISALVSLFRGLVNEVLSLAAWIIAFWVAFKFSGPVASVFAGMVSVPSVQLGLAFLALLIGTLVLCGLVNFVIGKLIETTGLSATDRLLGILFGIARGIAIITILVVLAGLTPVTRDPWWQQSLFLPRLERLAQWVIGWLPPEVGRRFTFAATTVEAE